MMDDFGLHFSFHDRPVEWIEEFLGVHLYSRQREIARALASPQYDELGTPVPKKVGVAAAHSVGKSYLSAALLLWTFFTHRESRCIVTAPVKAQADMAVMDAVANQLRNAPRPLPCEEYRDEIRMIHPLGGHYRGWRLYPRVARTGTEFQGIHGPTVAVVIDETTGISQDIFDAVMSLGHTPSSWVLLIGNPTERGGAFHNACRGMGGFRPFKISAFDTPNFTGERVHKSIENLITPGWVRENSIDMHGKESHHYETRVLANFPDADRSSLLYETHLNDALDRPVPDNRPPPRVLGIDVASTGEDHTCVVGIHGRYMFQVLKESVTDSFTDFAGWVAKYCAEEGIEAVAIDGTGGFGKPVYDVICDAVDDRVSLRDMRVECVGFADAPKRKRAQRAYVNKRAEIFWHLREFFHETQPTLDPSLKVTALHELSELRYKHKGDKIQIEAKDDIRKRLSGRSPDFADAAALACWARRQALAYE